MGLCLLMRIGVATFGIAWLVCGAVQASSFVTVGEPASDASPSIVDVAAPTVAASLPQYVEFSSERSVELATLVPLNILPASGASVVRMEPLSPSVVAVVSPEADVSNEVVAAIKQRNPRNEPLPMVMRGGIIGDPFAAEVELSKALDKLPGKGEPKSPFKFAAPAAPTESDQPQVKEGGAPMPANGTVAADRPRHPAFQAK
jgi:hypothetical protein